MKVLVIGASGQVGNSLFCGHNVFALGDITKGTYWTSQQPGCVPFDMSNRFAFKQLMDLHKQFPFVPDVIYLPAWVSNVDECQREPEKTWTQNVEGLKHVVNFAKEIGAFLVFYSSDFVFDGKEGLYSENALPRPINEYGYQKLIAEQYIATHLVRYLIIRTGQVYGPEPQGKNYALRMTKLLSEGKEVQACIDEFGTPTYGPNLADISIKLVKSGVTGLIHVTGADFVNRYKFMLAVARHFDLDERLIKPCQSADLKRPATRPLVAGLSSNRIPELQKLNIVEPAFGYEQGLKNLKAEIYD